MLFASNRRTDSVLNRGSAQDYDLSDEAKKLGGGFLEWMHSDLAAKSLAVHLVEQELSFNETLIF